MSQVRQMLVSASEVTEAEYLHAEQFADTRHEFIDGAIYAMAGAGYNHNCIAANIARKLGNHLEGTPCATFIADMKVRLGKDYVYPDVVVDCSKMGGDDYFAAAPIVVVEVLSKSTRKIDTTTKLIRYINLPSLQEYLLIEPDFVSVQVLRRVNHWQPEYFYLGDSVTLAALDLTLAVADIYDRVNNQEMEEFRRVGIVVEAEVGIYEE